MKNEEYSIERKLLIRLYAALAIYAAAGFLAVVFLGNTLPISENPVLSWLCLRLDMIYIFCLAVGFICIFRHYWKKPWGYLDEVVSATKTVYEQNDQAIALSEPLCEVESQMNQIKMSVLLSKQAAKEAEERKNDLVMCLAHDIRTPLTTVIGYLNLLHETPDIPPEQRAKYTDIALDKAERLEMLINELFDITRYNTQAVRLQKETVDLYALLAQVVEEFYPALSSRGNTVDLSTNESLWITADPEKLARVFSNLLKNAASYSFPDTTIHISAKRLDSHISVSFQNHGNTIPPENLSHIFDRFNRLDDARLSDTGGAGLGLSIAKEIVLRHGGDISAKSIDNTVTFTITLPSDI